MRGFFLIDNLSVTDGLSLLTFTLY